MQLYFTLDFNMRKFFLPLLFTISIFQSVTAQNNQQSLLWEITGNGLKSPSYLYGTMHVSNKIAFHLGDTFFMALDNADLICLESDPGTWIEEMYTSNNGRMMSRFNSYGYGGGNFYEKLVDITAPEKKDLENALREKHALENGFLYRGSNYNEEYEESTYLDLFIYQYARKNKTPVQNLEDFEETNKLQILSMLPDEEDEDEKEKNKKRKKSYYSKWNKDMSVREAMEDAYRNGKIDIIDSITRMTARSENYLHYFLHERNRIMVENMDSLMKTKTIFSGIGAAHLPGENGAIEMLRAKGYNVRAVIRNKSDLAKKKKDDIEKKFLELPYKTFTSKDGYITADLPGKLYETNGSDGELQYFFPDMANGGNFFISRFRTYSPLKEMTPKMWQKKVDSLLFENVEGKIIEQKEIKVNGFDAIRITNKTRRGDYQKRLIVFTPLEIIFFKMSGTGEWAKIYGDKFINSISINHDDIKETKYTSHLNDYEITFPGKAIHSVHATEITSSPGRYNIQSYTPNDSAYYLIQTDWLNDFGYIEEDTFELSYLFNVFADELDSVKSVKTLVVNNDNATGKITLNDGTEIHLKSYLWKNYYYLMVAKSSATKAEKFFNSFTLIDQNLEDEYVTFNDTLLRYSVTAPKSTLPDELEELGRYVRGKSSRNKKEDWDYVKHYRNFFYKKNYESIEVKYLKHSDYYHFETLKEFWEDELEGYLDNTYIVKKEEYIKNDTLPSAHVIVSDTGSQKVIELKAIISKGVVYTITTTYNSAQPKSKFIKTFFDTFKPNRDTLLGKEITESNAPLFFSDLASNDSVRVNRAVNLVNRIDFTKDHVDSLIWYIDNFEFPEDDEEGTIPYLIQQLGYLKHHNILPYLESKYEASTDDYELQFACLKALGKYGTKKSYKLMNKLLLQEPPITPNDNPIETFFYYLDDSLSLTAKLYPDLWDLMLYTEYRESVYDLSARLLDSNLIKSSSYKREKPLILREAKAETTSLGNSYYSSSSSSSVSLKDMDYYYSFGEKVSYPINLIDQYEISTFLKLLKPYYKKDKKVQKFMNGLLTHEKEKYRFVSAVVLTDLGVEIEDSLYTNLSKSPDYRFAFYKALKFIGKEDKFDTEYLSQQSLMESAIFASSSIDTEDSVKFVSKEYIKNKYDEGYVYFFKHQSDYNSKWYIHYAGLQPKDTTMINPKVDMDYIDRKASSVYTEAEIDQEIEDWVKYLKLIGRERAARKSSSYDYDYSW